MFGIRRERYHPKFCTNLPKIGIKSIYRLYFGVRCYSSSICTEQVLLRIIGAQRKRPDHLMTSYNRALEITGCESIEATLRTRRLLWAGTLLRMSGGRLPKRIVFGNFEGAVRRGRGGKEKEWTDCVQSDTRAFGIAGDWKATALKAEVWVETVTEGGRRFMAAWRKEEVDAARHRQEKREATRLGPYYRRRECRILRIHTHRPSRRAEGILVRTRDRPRPT